MTTTMTPLSTVIGVFPDHGQVDSVIDELRRSKFSYARIRLVQRGTGNFLDTLKGLFTGQASMASSTAEVLMKMGMPEHDARYYQGELDAGCVLILMNADERPEEAFKIMRQNGAIDISSRLKTSPSNAQPEAYNPNGSRETNIPDATPYPAVPPTTNSDAPARSNAPSVPPTTNPVAPVEVYNPDVSQEIPS
jgi:hypothetical protein